MCIQREIYIFRERQKEGAGVEEENDKGTEENLE